MDLQVHLINGDRLLTCIVSRKRMRLRAADNSNLMSFWSLVLLNHVFWFILRHQCFFGISHKTSRYYCFNSRILCQFSKIMYMEELTIIQNNTSEEARIPPKRLLLLLIGYSVSIRPKSVSTSISNLCPKK